MYRQNVDRNLVAEELTEDPNPNDIPVPQEPHPIERDTKKMCTYWGYHDTHCMFRPSLAILQDWGQRLRDLEIQVPALSPDPGLHSVDLDVMDRTQEVMVWGVTRVVRVTDGAHPGATYQERRVEFVNGVDPQNRLIGGFRRLTDRFDPTDWKGAGPYYQQVFEGDEDGQAHYEPPAPVQAEARYTARHNGLTYAGRHAQSTAGPPYVVYVLDEEVARRGTRLPSRAGQADGVRGYGGAVERHSPVGAVRPAAAAVGGRPEGTVGTAS